MHLSSIDVFLDITVGYLVELALLNGGFISILVKLAFISI
jgi:hypothetical protein